MWSNLPELAAESNLVFRVTQFLLDEFKPAEGVDIHLEKRIPLAAGLGGGSSNAATTLRALNSLWGLGLSIAELEVIAARFGSDIPYFLHGGAAWATHKGEAIQPRPDIRMELLLVNPNVRITSAEAYGLVSVASGENRRRFEATRGTAWLFNRLEQGIRRAYPAVDRVLNEIMEAGAETALMSGSGSTCFGIFADPARMRACKLHFDRIGYWTKIVRTISRIEYESEFEA